MELDQFYQMLMEKWGEIVTLARKMSSEQMLDTQINQKYIIAYFTQFNQMSADEVKKYIDNLTTKGQLIHHGRYYRIPKQSILDSLENIKRAYPDFNVDAYIKRMEQIPTYKTFTHKPKFAKRKELMDFSRSVLHHDLKPLTNDELTELTMTLAGIIYDFAAKHLINPDLINRVNDLITKRTKDSIIDGVITAGQTHNIDQLKALLGITNELK